MGNVKVFATSHDSIKTLFSARNLHEDSSVPISVTHDLEKDEVQSPPNTNLQMDWADACSLGRIPSLNQCF